MEARTIKLRRECTRAISIRNRRLSVSQFTIAIFVLADMVIAYSLIAQFGIYLHGQGATCLESGGSSAPRVVDISSLFRAELLRCLDKAQSDARPGVAAVELENEVVLIGRQLIVAASRRSIRDPQEFGNILPGKSVHGRDWLAQWLFSSLRRKRRVHFAVFANRRKWRSLPIVRACARDASRFGGWHCPGLRTRSMCGRLTRHHSGGRTVRWSARLPLRGRG